MRLSRRSFTASAAAVPFLIPAITAGQSSSPQSGSFAPASERIQELLPYVPGGDHNWEQGFIWLDIERQIATIREHAGAEADEYTDAELAMRALYTNVPDYFAQAALLKDYAGYEISEVLQSVQFGSPLALTQLVRLQSRAEDLIPFWESVEYEERENDYGRFWTIGEGGELDLSHPVQRGVLARFNNIAIMDENVLVYASTADLVQQTMATTAGDIPNRIEDLLPVTERVAEDTTSIWQHDGDTFIRPYLFGEVNMPEQTITYIEAGLEESDEAVGRMPVIRSFTTGITAGAIIKEDLDDDSSDEFIVLELLGQGEAGQAADVIAWRLENLSSLRTGEPYAELLPGATVDVIDDEHVRITAPLTAPRALFVNMIMARDTLLFVYD